MHVVIAFSIVLAFAAVVFGICYLFNVLTYKQNNHQNPVVRELEHQYMMNYMQSRIDRSEDRQERQQQHISIDHIHPF